MVKTFAGLVVVGGAMAAGVACLLLAFAAVA